jgi:hypothetical protein
MRRGHRLRLPRSCHQRPRFFMSEFLNKGTIRQREGANMIGKFAWLPSDWLSENFRLETSTISVSNSSSHADGPSPLHLRRRHFPSVSSRAVLWIVMICSRTRRLFTSLHRRSAMPTRRFLILNCPLRRACADPRITLTTPATSSSALAHTSLQCS